MEKNNDELLLRKMGELSMKLRREMFGRMEDYNRLDERMGGPEGRGPHGRGFGGPEGRGPHGRGFGGPEGHGPHGRGFGGPEGHGPHGGEFGGPEGHGPHGRGFGGPEGHGPHGGEFGGPEECLEISEENFDVTDEEETPPPFEAMRERESYGSSAFRRPHMARERILRIIGEEEGISQKKLAEAFRIRPQSLSELLGKLARDGYVTRLQNEQDKREILVYLTEEGKLRAEEVEAARARQTAALFSPLTDEEKETLLALLEKLIQ